MKYNFTLFIAAVSAIVPSFTPKFSPRRKIVGGNEVTPFKYRFMASIHRYGVHRCGGTRYTGNVIVTAAHCTHDDENEIYDVILHRHNFDLPEKDEQAKRYAVLKRVRHSEYIAKTYQNDIALWKIDAPSSGFKGIGLDEKAIGATTNTLLTVAGWGYTSEGGQLSSVLRETKVPIVDSKICQAQLLKGGDPLFPEVQICAGYPEGKHDACQSDSGGPLFSTKSPLPVLVGIVSWGNGCAKANLPGVYTKITPLIPWINKTIKSL